MKFINSISIILLFPLIANAQTVTLEKSDAEIVEEHNKIVISGDKLAFIFYNFISEKKIVLKSEKGITYFSTIKLPENFDPTLISHFPQDRNYQHAYSNMEIENVEVFKLVNGEKAKISSDIIKNEVQIVREDSRYGSHDTYNIDIKDLGMGDTLLVNYAYRIKFHENIYKMLSMRYFFHSNVFKKLSTLSIIRNSKLSMAFNYNNEAKPDSIFSNDKTIEHFWLFNNLNECIFEAGSRPFIELPNVIFSVEPNDLLYTYKYSVTYDVMPLYAVYLFHREKYQTGIYAAIDQGVKSKQYRLINNFVSGKTSSVTEDSMGYKKLEALHHSIVETFTFENDTDYFENRDVRDPRIGDYLVKQTLRDINRYTTYIALIRSIGLEYFTSYLIDKRSGLIDLNFFSPMYESDYLIAAVTKDKKLQYIYPKKHKFGYYLNELPFYYENTFCYLVHPYDYLASDRPISESLINTHTPKSSLKSNKRTNNIMVDVNLAENKLDFKSRIGLTGQYSTLGRGSYLYNYHDITVNDLYGKKIWEINGDVKVKNQKCTIKSKEFPYKAEVTAEYELSNSISKSGDTLTLSLNNWFNHILIDNVKVENRNLNFYADFIGMDSYVYFLKFSENIKLCDKSINTVISNEFGKYEISVDQVQPNAIKISSSFITHTNIIEADKINSVVDIYSKIKELNNYKLFFLRE